MNMKTVSNDLSLLIEQFRYEINYVDYAPDQFTVPVILTRERAEQILADNSISKVRFSPILNSDFNFSFDAKDLVMS